MGCEGNKGEKRGEVKQRSEMKVGLRWKEGDGKDTDWLAGETWELVDRTKVGWLIEWKEER